MQAGRELDAVIAEKILGCKPEPSYYHTTDAPDYDCRCRGLAHEDPERGGLRHYSSDIGDAWEVVEKLSGTMGFEIRRIQSWYASFDGDEAIADDAPLAISLAALKAVGA